MRVAVVFGGGAEPTTNARPARQHPRGVEPRYERLRYQPRLGDIPNIGPGDRRGAAGLTDDRVAYQREVAGVRERQT